MLLQKIVLENYGIYQNENVFDFTTTKEKPIILCGGKNGGGKTTLFESIMLCLYGQNSTEKKITKKEYEQILGKKIHEYGSNQDKNTSITIEFLYYHYDRDEKSKEGNDIQRYSIKRSWKKVNNEIVEQTVIKKNDQPLDVDDWEAFVRELIPRGIARLFFFDGEKIATIAKKGGEDIEVKKSFEILLGLDIVYQLKSDLEINLGRSNENQNNVSEIENKIKKLKDEIEFFEGQKASEVIHLHEREDEMNNVFKKIDHIEEEISKLGGTYSVQRTELNSKQVVLKDKLTVIEDEIRLLCADVLPFSLIPKQLDQLEQSLKLDQETLKERFKKQILNENLDELKKQLDNDDFWSKISLDSSAKSSVISKIEEIYEKKTPNESSNQKMIIGFSQQDSEKILGQNERINDVLPRKMESLAKEFNAVTEQLQKVITALSNAPDDEDVKPMVKSLNSEHEKIGVLKTEVRHLEDKIRSKNAEITTKKIEIRKEIEQQYNAKDVDTNIALTKKVQKALDEYAVMLKNKKIHLLENYIFESLKILLHKENFITKVTINNETFEITLYDSDENVILRDKLSEGEKQMFATSILWALAKTSGRSLPFIIDTPLARLDLDHRSNLVQEFFPTASHQVIILSTDTEITKPYYDKLLPHITRSYSMTYDYKMKCSKISDKYFEFVEEEIAV